MQLLRRLPSNAQPFPSPSCLRNCEGHLIALVLESTYHVRQTHELLTAIDKRNSRVSVICDTIQYRCGVTGSFKHHAEGKESRWNDRQIQAEASMGSTACCSKPARFGGAISRAINRELEPIHRATIYTQPRTAAYWFARLLCSVRLQNTPTAIQEGVLYYCCIDHKLCATHAGQVFRLAAMLTCRSGTTREATPTTIFHTGVTSNSNVGMSFPVHVRSKNHDIHAASGTYSGKQERTKPWSLALSRIRGVLGQKHRIHNICVTTLLCQHQHSESFAALVLYRTSFYMYVLGTDVYNVEQQKSCS